MISALFGLHRHTQTHTHTFTTVTPLHPSPHHPNTTQPYIHISDAIVVPDIMPYEMSICYIDFFGNALTSEVISR